MGCSYSDYDLNIQTKEEAIEVYTRSIEEWRKNLGIKEYFQLGHSLGAFLSCHFLKRYKPEGVLGFFMMSPAGMNFMPENEEKDFFEGRTWFQKGVQKRVIYLIEVKHWDVNKIFKILNAGKMSKKYFSRPLMNLSEKEVEILSDYIPAIFELNPVGHKLLGFFLKFFRYSTSPFCEFLDELSLKYNIVIIFGDKDWMNVSLAKKTIDSITKEEKNKDQCKLEPIKLIKDCGHQMMFESPKRTLKKIMRYYYKFSMKNNNQLDDWTERNINNTVLGYSIMDSVDVDSENFKANVHNAPNLFGVNRKEKKESKIAAKFKQWFGKKPKPTENINQLQHDQNQLDNEGNIEVPENQMAGFKKKGKSKEISFKKTSIKKGINLLEKKSKKTDEINWKLIQNTMNLLNFINESKFLENLKRLDTSQEIVCEKKNEKEKFNTNNAILDFQIESLNSSNDEKEVSKIIEMHKLEDERSEPEQVASNDDDFLKNLNEDFENLTNVNENNLIVEAISEKSDNTQDEMNLTNELDTTEDVDAKKKKKLTKEEKAEQRQAKKQERSEKRISEKLERHQIWETKKKEKDEKKIEKQEVKDNKKKERELVKERLKSEKISKKENLKQDLILKKEASIHVEDNSSKDEQINSNDSTSRKSGKSDKSLEIKRICRSLDYIRTETKTNKKITPKKNQYGSEKFIIKSLENLKKYDNEKANKTEVSIKRRNSEISFNYKQESKYDDVYKIKGDKIVKNAETKKDKRKINSMLAKLRILIKKKEKLVTHIAKIVNGTQAASLNDTLDNIETSFKGTYNYETEKKLQNIWNKLQQIVSEINL